MSNSASGAVIRLRGVRHNNLKSFDLDLPLHRLIVITGLSGSGKSSLAFDTLYAEGQRRYIETFSPYARQFFDRMDKPQVDSIEGIPPAIAIEQRNAVRTTRSTVGTMTEICDHLKVLWPHLAQLHCRGCGRPVTKTAPPGVWQALSVAPSAEVLITFEVPLSEKLSLAESLALIAKQGYQRLLVNGEVTRLDEAAKLATLQPPPTALIVVQDRLKLTPTARARIIEACEQAYHFGKGKLTVWTMSATTEVRQPRRFSNWRHCAQCDIEYPEATPALFSFNHPLGACPTCKGFGRTITIDYDLALPDRTLTLAEGAIKPWRNGFSAECQRDLKKFCQARKVPMNVPFHKLAAEHQRWVIEGDKDYGIDEAHEWPRAWYGVKGYFRWLETKSYKMHVRVLLSRYRAYTRCPDCHGARLKPEALLYWLNVDAAGSKSPKTSRAATPTGNTSQPTTRLTLPDFYALPIRDALNLVNQLIRQRSRLRKTSPQDSVRLALDEVRTRLAYLDGVGLGYLTLDRPTRTLSGGETERVNLTTCLGTRLVNTLFVLDEPSVGLHPRDTDRLVRILEKLRDTGNTVVVVEHEAGVMRAADQIVDIGPGHGATGGEIVFQGPLRDLLKSKTSLTGQYLSGRKRIELSQRRPIHSAAANGAAQKPKADQSYILENSAMLKIEDATRHNLNHLSVEIPLGRFVVVTGVSGSGKSTLIRDVLLPTLQARLHDQDISPTKASDRLDSEESVNDAAADQTANHSPALTQITGYETLRQVVLVDQSALGKTPRSNPAVYIGAFDDIREVFAQSDIAKQRGLNASAFSFNSSVGQCEKCHGAGFEKIEMQFLSDIFIRCPECDGRRYRQHILDLKISPPRPASATTPQWSIGDFLEATVDEVIDFLAGFADSKPARRATASLKLLQEVGLGYLRLGQPINTLSGGESQRLKLVRHLAEATQHSAATDRPANRRNSKRIGHQPAATATLFLFDEPTTGLHFDDVRVLLQVFQRLVAAGHSVVVIEHNLEVIKCADWIIDLGPEAGAEGGKVVATGTPENIARNPASHTGQYLRRSYSGERAPRRRPRDASLRNQRTRKL
ncbi:MAG: excinuclease ABC subunit UvrA [Verrucomicrobiae bacterium]|nr:excinuclease ABC subunit UvrA [Verrucomicrobiae bacterium]